VGLVVVIVATGLWPGGGVAATVVLTGVGCTVIITVCIAVILAGGRVGSGGDSLHIATVVILRVELLLQQQELLTILLLDSSKSVDIVLELCPGSLLPLGVCQPPPEALDQLMVCDPPPTGQHQLPHRF